MVHVVLTQNIQPDIRRDKLDIILRILTIGNSPVKKTHILYKAGINFYQLSRYLDLLLKTGMMEQVNEPFLAFRTTEKGRVMLNLFGGTELEVSDAPNFLSKMVEAEVTSKF
jgi:predicted transcriptional regulator